MAITTYERTNTFKTTVTWMSSNSYVDPSANKSFVKIYDPDGNLYLTGTGIKDSTGIYHYYISTQSDATLGLWKIQWYSYFDYGSPFNYQKKSESEFIELVDVQQT